MLLSLKVDVKAAMKQGFLYDSEIQTMLISQQDLDRLSKTQRELLADSLKYNQNDDLYEVKTTNKPGFSYLLVLNGVLTLEAIIESLEANKAECDKYLAEQEAARLQVEQEELAVALECLNTFNFANASYNNSNVWGEFRSNGFKSSYMHQMVNAYESVLKERYPTQFAAYEAKLEEVKQQQLEAALQVVKAEEQEILDWIHSHGSLSLRDKVRNKESFLSAYLFEYNEYKQWEFHKKFDQVYRPLGFVLDKQLTRSDFSEYATPTNNQYLKLKNLQNQLPEVKLSLMQIDDPGQHLRYLVPEGFDTEHLFDENSHPMAGLRPHPATIVICGELGDNCFYLPDLDAIKQLIQEVVITL